MILNLLDVPQADSIKFELFCDAIPFKPSHTGVVAIKPGSTTKILNEENWLELLKNNQKKLLGIILILGFPIGSLLYFIITLLKSVFYAYSASILAKILNYNLNFKQLTRLAIIVNAPATIISTFIILLFFGAGASSNISQIIAGNIYLFYFVFVFILCGKQNKP